MKTKTNYILLVLAVLLLSIDTADACSLNPTAVITTDPDATVFYNDEPVLLSGENSVANCGFITEYRWLVSQIGGGGWQQIYIGSSPTYNYTFPLLEDGESEKAYYLQLVVRNSSNNYHTRTIQVTITRDNKSFYYLTDHLGSVRVTVDERGDPVGWDDYYPFGLQMPGRSQQQYGSPATDVKYTGHELNQEGGLGIYHAGARLYDPAVGRFMQQDPMTGKYPGWSPYNYVLGNPVVFVDPDGREVWAYNEDWINRIASELNERIPGIGISNEQRTREVEDGDGNVIVEEYYALTILEDSGFDWGEDIYTNALYDVISSPDIDFKVIVSEEYYGTRESYHGTSMKSWGGGRIDPRRTGGEVWLHPDPVTGGNPFIGIFLHEAVGHGHPNMTNATEIEERFGLANRVPHHGFVGGIRWKEIDLYKKRR